MTEAQMAFVAVTLRDALNYIKHVGANQTMRGEPHPQQWLVENLASAIKIQEQYSGDGEREA